MRTLVLGGIRSGKSEHANRLLTGHAPVLYITTQPTLITDKQWAISTGRYFNRRQGYYETVETDDIAAALRSKPDTAAMIGDLSLWVAAYIQPDDDEDTCALSDILDTDLADLCSAIAEHRAEVVVVSHEVGLAIAPSTTNGRRFQDFMGRANAAISEVVDRTTLVVAGCTLELPIREQATKVQDYTSRRPTVTNKAFESSPKSITRDSEIFGPIEAPDTAAAREAISRQTILAKQSGSFGRLGDIGIWMSACQGTCPPRPINDATVVIFAGDHGVAAADSDSGSVSAFPQEMTAQMVSNLVAGDAVVNLLARRANAYVHVEDISVVTDTAPQLSRYKVCRGSYDLRKTDAITLEQAREGVGVGRAIADEMVDTGSDLLIAGEIGIGNDIPSAIIIGLLTHREPVEVVDPEAGVDHEYWIRKTAAIRDGMWRGRSLISDPLSLVAAVGGADLAAMAGFLAQAAIRKTPVILDGVVVSAAALIAESLAPGVADWWQAGHQSADPAHAFALNRLGVTPILELGMGLGEASGAVAALPLVASSVDILASYTPFSKANISNNIAE